MAKKKDTQESVDNVRIETHERLRDELFQYRIEIKSFQRSIKVIASCVTVILGLFAFFGYDRIESVVRHYETRADKRLARTDSLLSAVDTRALDSLIETVAAKTAIYEKALSELERGSQINAELFSIILRSLPYNSHIEHPIEEYHEKSYAGVFDVVFYTERYEPGQTAECHVVLNDSTAINPEDVFIVAVFPTDSHLAVFYQTFTIQGKYNRLPFVFAKYEKYTEYTLSVTLLKDSETPRIGYNSSMPVLLKESR